jgi:chromate transporter
LAPIFLTAGLGWGASLPARAWAAAGEGASASAATLVALFWTCFKAGLFVFGSGLAIVPLLEHEMVTRYGWITHAQFMDGLVIGQVTPGPVTITTTFIGFQMAGLVGAVVGTVGIFLPAFLIVLFVLPLFWKRVSGTPAAEGFARFAIPAVIGGILGATVRLSEVATHSAVHLTGNFWGIGLVFGVAAVAAFSRRVPAWALIPMGGVGLQIIDTMSHV